MWFKPCTKEVAGTPQSRDYYREVSIRKVDIWNVTQMTHSSKQLGFWGMELPGKYQN